MGNNWGIDFSYRDNDDPDDIGGRNVDPDFSTNYVWADPEPEPAFPTKIPSHWGQMIAGAPADPLAPLDNGTITDPTERVNYVHDVLGTWVGDSNLDGEFNSSDLVVVFTGGEYEDTVAGNSTWVTGDWNGNGEFDSSDLVAAFTDGGYEIGPRPATAAVPEPFSGALLLSAFACLVLPLPRLRRQAVRSMSQLADDVQENRNPRRAPGRDCFTICGPARSPR